MAPQRSFIAMAAFVLVFPMVSLAGLEQAPLIPRGQGEACVADTEFMRRNHMTLLRHQRDETMRQGIRGQQYSLRECVACHAVQGPDARAVSIASPNHFCRACHDYAAVQIDCFQCHASRPDSEDVTVVEITRE